MLRRADGHPRGENESLTDAQLAAFNVAITVLLFVLMAGLLGKRLPRG
jgi:hypothetical protein